MIKDQMHKKESQKQDTKNQNKLMPAASDIMPQGK